MSVRDPSDPLGAFVGLRNMLLVYVAIAAIWLAGKVAFGTPPECSHPVECMEYYYEGPFPGWRVFKCHVCLRELPDSLPIVSTTEAERREYRDRMDRLAEKIKELRRSGHNARRETMSHGVEYSVPNRAAQKHKAYQGAVSRGPGWEMRWAGPHNPGPVPEQMIRATLMHLSHLQNTSDMASEQNAKMLYRLQQLVDEIDGNPEQMGGSLNDLIPE